MFDELVVRLLALDGVGIRSGLLLSRSRFENFPLTLLFFGDLADMLCLGQWELWIGGHLTDSLLLQSRAWFQRRLLRVVGQVRRRPAFIHVIQWLLRQLFPILTRGSGEKFCRQHLLDDFL